MRAAFSILALLFCTANHCSTYGNLVRGNRFETKQHHFVPLLPDAATSGGGIAWLVQTGAATAREAVVAMLLTTLQHQHNRTGLVADVEFEDIIPLADTGHQVETWSQQHWAAEVAKADQLDPDTSGKEIQFISQTHPHYYQHWAHKVLAGFESAHTRWPEAEWYIMIEDDTYVFQDTIQAFLAQFDPQQAHYLGYPTRGATQCRDPTDPAPQDRGQTFHLTDSPTQQELDHPVASSTVQLQSIRQILINTGVLKQQESNRRSLIPEASQYNSPHTPYTPLHSQHQQHNEGSQLPQDASAQQAPDAQSMTSTAAQQQPATAVDPPTIPIAQQQSSEEMFALSGAGMILSQGAMVKLGPLLRGCMLSSQDCYLDDVRLFLCLKEAGISLNTASNYEALTFAPNSNIDWGRFHPCTRAVVFHGVDPMAMHMLWEAEQQHNGQPTMADLFAHISLWGEHSERPGLQYDTEHVFRNITGVIDRRTCREACEQHPLCKGWNFHFGGHYCELLDKLTKPVEQWRVDSGISQPAYVCPEQVRIAEQ